MDNRWKYFKRIFLFGFSHVNRKTQYENPVAAAKKNREHGKDFSFFFFILVYLLLYMYIVTAHPMRLLGIVS